MFHVGETHVVVLDFPKTFDRVWHAGLLLSVGIILKTMSLNFLLSL